MKKFEIPEIEFVICEAEDVITASNGDNEFNNPWA